MSDVDSDFSAGRLQRVLDAGRFAITAEITPPATLVADYLLKKALPLKGLADAVNVTDGASARAALSPVAAAALMVQAGMDPVLQLTCRDRNRIALQGDLMAAAAFGVRNLLLLTGDDPKAGDQPDTKAVFDITSAALMDTARRMRDDSELPNGRKLTGTANFYLGGADAPIDPTPGWEPKSLLAKAAGGMQFAQTQFCMDLGVVRRYVAALEAAGLAGKFHLLIGIAPMASAKSGRWMKENLWGTVIADEYLTRMDEAADPKAEGRAIAVELLRGLAEIKGIAGAHIMAPLNEASIPLVINEVADIRGGR